MCAPLYPRSWIRSSIRSSLFPAARSFQRPVTRGQSGVAAGSFVPPAPSAAQLDAIDQIQRIRKYGRRDGEPEGSPEQPAEPQSEPQSAEPPAKRRRQPSGCPSLDETTAVPVSPSSSVTILLPAAAAAATVSAPSIVTSSAAAADASAAARAVPSTPLSSPPVLPWILEPDPFGQRRWHVAHAITYDPKRIGMTHTM